MGLDAQVQQIVSQAPSNIQNYNCTKSETLING